MADHQEIVWAVLLLCAKDEQNEALFKRALLEAKNTNGEYGLPVGSVLAELARYYRANDRIDEALDCEERAEKILRNYVANQPDIVEKLKKMTAHGDDCKVEGEDRKPSRKDSDGQSRFNGDETSKKHEDIQVSQVMGKGVEAVPNTDEGKISH